MNNSMLLLKIYFELKLNNIVFDDVICPKAIVQWLYICNWIWSLKY